MTCAECGGLMQREGRYWICENHEPVRAVPAEAEASTPLATVVPDLPLPLALLLSEYLREPHPYIKLHRLCDAAEMLTRFLAATALAELTAAGVGPSDWPGGLRAAVDPAIQRPTFGNWVSILREAVAALPPGIAAVVPELPRLVRLLLAHVGSQGTDRREEKVLPLRNALVHDARWTVQTAREMLTTHGHGERFDALWLSEEARVLRELKVAGVGNVGAVFLLRGLPSRNATGDPIDLPGMREPPVAGSILLFRDRDARCLNLTPLHIFGPVLHGRDDRLEVRTRERVAQIYARRPAKLPEYTALHDRLGYGVGDAALATAFDTLFPVAEWHRARRDADAAKQKKGEVQREAAAFTFREMLRQVEAEPFVGRDRDLAAAVSWLDARPDGKTLLLGAPGMGKTAFAARLASRLARERSRWIPLHHFFKSDDPRCSALQFMRGVLVRLSLHTGEAFELPYDEHQAAVVFLESLDRFSGAHLGNSLRHERLVLILDGLDELSGRGRVLLDMLARSSIPRVSWFCLSRPEHWVIDALPPTSVARLFPSADTAAGSGLPPLDARAVRAYLIEEMERRRYELLAAEDEQGDSAFLEALTDRSRSLPLYFRMLVEDLRQNRFDLDDPGALPATLDAYYHDLIDRLAMDAARGVLPAIIALLAMAEAPLSDALLRSLLASHHLAGSPEWSAVVEHALRIGHVMMRDSWLGDDRTGYALHHETFREYLRARERVSYAECRMAPELQAARARLLDLCVEWPAWAATTDEGRYIRRYGAIHLAESERWSELEDALEDPSWDLLRRWTELGDAEQGIRCLPGLIAFHDRRPDGQGRAALLATQLGRLLTHTGDRAGSREWLEFAIARAAGESADRSWVIATHELGSLDFYEGDLTAAATRYRLALDRARSARPEVPGEVAANLLALATIEVLAHRSATALELATEAQQLAERGRDTAHLCAAHRVSASALKETCQYVQAGERIEKALALSMLAGLPAEEAASAMSRAWLGYHMAVPQDLTMLAEAAALCDAACRQARACSRILLLAATQVCRATIALARRLPSQAEEALHWLDRMSEDRIPYDLRVDRLLLRAKILHASAGANAAERAYRDAGAAAAALHMKARQADAAVGLGAAYFWQQRRSLARDAWAQANASAQATSPHRYRLTRLSIEAARRASDIPPY